MEQVQNFVSLCGYVADGPTECFTARGKAFCQLLMAVPRNSGYMDTLTVILPSDRRWLSDIKKGDRIKITGSFKSYNHKTCERTRLILNVYARSGELCRGSVTAENQIKITGYVCKDPVYRKTPLGKEICDIMLAVHGYGFKSDYIPCILWGKNALSASKLKVGDKIVCEGRIQSREYMKETPDGTMQRVAFEVSIAKFEVSTR